MKAKHGWFALGALIITGALTFQGCGNSSGSNPAPGGGGSGGGSCTIVVGLATICQDYTGSAFTTATGQTACSGSSGTYSASACTTSGRVGSCKFYGGQSGELIYRYLSGWTDGNANTSCTTASPPGVYTSG